MQKMNVAAKENRVVLLVGCEAWSIPASIARGIGRGLSRDSFDDGDIIRVCGPGIHRIPFSGGKWAPVRNFKDSRCTYFRDEISGRVVMSEWPLLSPEFENDANGVQPSDGVFIDTTGARNIRLSSESHCIVPIFDRDGTSDIRSRPIAEAMWVAKMFGIPVDFGDDDPVQLSSSAR